MEAINIDQSVTVLVLEVIPSEENHVGMGPPPQYKIRLLLVAVDHGSGKVRGGFVACPLRTGCGSRTLAVAMQAAQVAGAGQDRRRGKEAIGGRCVSIKWRFVRR